jgi:AcrR family transcriptional regulator
MNARSAVAAVASETGGLRSDVKDQALVERRRAQLVDASIRLFARQGYHPTSVRDIARAVGVSVGSVYTYFPSKEDILEFACGQMAAEFAVRFDHFLTNTNTNTDRGQDQDQEDSALVRLRQAFGMLVEMVEAQSDLHLVVYRESSALAPRARRRITDFELLIREIFAGLLREGIARGEVRPHDVALRAQTAVFLAHMWALKRWWLGAYTSLEHYADEQFHLLVGDIAPSTSDREEVSNT